MKIKTIFKLIRTLRQILTKIKNEVRKGKKKGVVYESEQSYVSETGRTLMRRIEEYKMAVRKDDKKNGIAVHVTTTKHQMNWKGSRVLSNINVTQYWRRRVIIISHQHTDQISDMNFDCGLKLNDAS